MMISRKEIESAYANIRVKIVKTPLVFSSELSRISGAQVYLKMENLQNTGSFKIRGVLNKINSLSHGPEAFNKTFVAASTGNHAAAFAYAAEHFGFKGVLFMPKKTNETKLQALEGYSIEKILYGENSMETEAKAGAYSKEIGGILIHPYNDPEIIKGQGTIGVEIKNQLPEVDTILAPIGGGGLISGLASYFQNDNVDVIGCQPVNASEMYDSIQHGHIVPPSTKDTIADASAGGIEENAITFDICKRLLSSIELSTEEDIEKALAFLVKYHHTIVEPTCAMPIATILNSKKYAGRTIVLVLTGKKIDISLLTNILNKYGNHY